jgi:hypothetical protein
VLDLSSFDLEEIGNVLADQTDYEHRWQWLADNSLIDDDAASRFLVGHPDPP